MAAGPGRKAARVVGTAAGPGRKAARVVGMGVVPVLGNKAVRAAGSVGAASGHE